jgi:hypothetical protein
MLEDYEGMAHLLMSVHERYPGVYKIDIWGNAMEVYPISLEEALQEANLLPGDDYKHFVLPDDFEIPTDCEEQRLECRITEVVQPVDWGNRDSVDLQFSANVKHTSYVIRTHSVNLGDLKKLFSE